jgi:hypothetical protein
MSMSQNSVGQMSMSQMSVGRMVFYQKTFGQEELLETRFNEKPESTLIENDDIHIKEGCRF